MIKILAPAKINLFLEVKNRRPDGYHNIDSVMQAVSLCDRITIVPDKTDLSLRCSLPELPCDEKNLALKAALRLKKELGVATGARITLEKNIPLGAGLGGGSSDAAAVLKGLLRLWKRSMPEKDLVKLAAGIGADVPFFFKGGAASVKGIGDIVEPLGKVPTAWFILINPGFGVPTPLVYQNLRLPLTKRRKINRIKQLLVQGIPPAAWGRHLFNRLEEEVLPNYPEIRYIKGILEGMNLDCLMSGSGSTVFGLLPSYEKGREIKSKLTQHKWGVWVVKSVP